LLINYTTGSFPTEYIPTVFDGYSAHVQCDEKRTIGLGLWDTVGTDEYNQLRPLSYPNADVVVLAFRCYGTKTQFELVTKKWLPELRKFLPDVPIVLCCTQTDRRTDGNFINDARKKNEAAKQAEDLQYFITSKEAMEIAVRYHCAAYVECSAVTGEGVKNVFDTCIAAAVMPQDRIKKHVMTKKKNCSVQ